MNHALHNYSFLATVLVACQMLGVTFATFADQSPAKASAEQSSDSSPAEDSARRFDFGEGDAAAGYFKVTQALKYDADRGYGWLATDANLEPRNRGTLAAPRRDFLLGKRPFTFRITGVKPGRYLLTIDCCDIQYADHVTRLRIPGSPLSFPIMAPRVGEFMTLTATITVNDSLDLVFDSPKSNWIVNSLTLEPTKKNVGPSITRVKIAANPSQN